MAPAASGRVFTACAINVGKSNVMSTPALGRPNGCPLMWLTIGRCTFPPSNADPSSSGVTATGENAVCPLLCRNPKPLASSGGMSVRKLTSLTSMNSLTSCAASPGGAPCGTSVTMTATSASRSRPHAASPRRIGSQGPEKRVRAAAVHERVGPERRGHLGAARLPHERDVVDVGRAVGPAEAARERRAAPGRIERDVGDASRLERVGDLPEPRLDGRPLLDGGPERRGDRGRVGRPRQVA